MSDFLKPHCHLIVTCGLVVFLKVGLATAREPPLGDAVVRGKVGASEIVITTTARLAGAIHSLTWNGKEFINSFDHGRQLQSASNFDCGRLFIPEIFNPTEAGSLADGQGQHSTSRLLRLIAHNDELETITQMAFWLAPGEKSQGHAAHNDQVLSNHLLAKRVRIGYKDMPQAIEYQVTFMVPTGQRHRYAQFEALTGYMPMEFRRFWRFEPITGRLRTLDDGPGEQSFPVVCATDTGSHALGIYSPDQPSRGFEGVGYGRFRFPTERVVKWNCVFRIQTAETLQPGPYSYRMFVVVGTLADVELTLRTLHQLFRAP